MVPGKNWQETASRTTSHILFATWDKATRIKIQRRFSLRGRRDEDAGSINHERARSKVQRECVRDRGWQSDYPKLRSGNASSAKEETGQNISQMFHEWSCVSVFFREIISATILFPATSERCLPRHNKCTKLRRPRAKCINISPVIRSSSRV